jgi:hypothetical protein
VTDEFNKEGLAIDVDSRIGWRSQPAIVKKPLAIQKLALPQWDVASS